MELADWRPTPEPSILWINTAILVLTSIVMQWSHKAAQSGNIDHLKKGLLISGVLTVVFLIGQLFAWKELMSLGYYLDNNPANSFFYLFTLLHAVHLIGGMVAWLKTTINCWRGKEPNRIALSVELCTVYWHYLLLLWLVLFGLLLST